MNNLRTIKYRSAEDRISYKAEILADSIGPNGARLTTMKVTYPRFVHAEHLRHRSQSFSVESSRARPFHLKLREVLDYPVVPLNFGAKQTGMVAGKDIGGWKTRLARQAWLKSRYFACAGAWLIDKLGVHKSIPNRIIEPWAWVTVICTATEWENFFNLRVAPDAQDEIREIATMMKALYKNSAPRVLQAGEWHLPFISEDERDLPAAPDVSAGRVAKESSYVSDTSRESWDTSLDRSYRLSGGSHWSPFEHQGKAQRACVRTQSGNFIGFDQYRKDFPGEAVKEPAAQA